MKFYPEKPDIRRLREIIQVFWKYQFGEFLGKTKFKERLFKPLRLYFRDPEMEVDASAPERLRLAFEELGPTFIKLGQMLSTRPDMVGEEIAEELSKLQDEARPLDYREVKETIEGELKRSISDIFRDFGEDPIASASVGQVHEARLKDGRRVAVKVQRPSIEEKIRKDIIIMKYLAKLVDRNVPRLRYYNLPGIVEEFERSIFKELDYYNEANNIERFRSLFADDDMINAPRVYREYSTSRVLTMEYVEGVKLSDILKSPIKFNGKVIAKRGFECYFKQIFIHGFFHADPHPANIIVQEGGILYFIDFGMVGYIDKDFRDKLIELLISIIDYDVNGIIEEIELMGIISSETDKEALKYDIMDLFERYYGADLQRIGNIMKEFTMPRMLIRHKMEIPRNFVLLVRAISMIESIGERLDPQFNALEIAQEMVQKLIIARLNPLNIFKVDMKKIIQLEHLIGKIPQTFIKGLQVIGEGTIRIELEHKNLDELADRIERSSNRISLALLASALIIGSSMVITAELRIAPGIPYIGSLGFILSFLIGLGLLFSILKGGKYH
ncbi:AarF/ABC1/UbiB kinase family protein [Methanothermobacter tenebrarum]|uniref:AarF/ABC1/UbiB kinase family protein n=1 Tax=Methanothermobacter tenebrarum TaxID=680118 RepID=A0A328PFH6_9EURY|nr:AarF/ABC1/UbiB kinase family protein [Methanothermobacter tenebrarum]MBC7100868.1 AarF/ABC1/UbiB kinase family protein [Methanobacteriales archaeon]MBC7117842.1 AarF/ABC1/UbiB kinase family protein [Methanobacteriaceae archaeon]NPV64009.1 AarF/ABC1/UbiB kinase family protein [Methanobacteriaceae archaeon]RAO79182.1 AarF/ABC1/UbiB kinase family protein [Methanothermobacter tenebrarum]